jgi:CDP-diacylglycerol pyrophosphatase
MLPRPPRFLFAFLFLIGSAQGDSKPDLPRDLLWHVVQVCTQTYLLTGSPLPCLEVQSQDSSNPGFAIVPVPAVAEVLLVPTRKIAGIESPQLLTPGSPNWWEFAWDARRFLIERSQHHITDSNIALAVNSMRSRSQDQLHIHVACVHPAVMRKVKRFEGMIGGTWTRLPVRIKSQSWLAMRLVSKDLKVDPFALLADLVRVSGGPMADWGVAVLSWRFIDGTDGFIILATPTTDSRGEIGLLTSSIRTATRRELRDGLGLRISSA